MKEKVFIVLLFVFVLPTFVKSQEASFTLDDRDRIMRTEEKLEAFRNEVNIKLESFRNEMDSKFEAMNSKFEAMDSKFEAMDSKFEAADTKIEAINSKIETLYWGFGILIALMLFLFGYIVWDRRTALNPIQNKTMTLEERVNKIEFVYREQAQKDPGFAKILRHAGLL